MPVGEGRGVGGFGFKSHRPKPEKAPEEEPETSSRLRKKAAGPRPWLVVDEAGEARVVESGKQSVMRRTGLPGRDLRILDPALSCPSTILGRESAIVFKIEHVRLIITAHEVLLLNFEEPLVASFVQRLQSKIQLQLHHHSHDKKQEEGDRKTDIASMDKRKRDQPFEFVALEACLETTCSCLENEAATLEKEAHPALDKLTSQISTLNLEHVRRIKSCLVAISGRVQKVRDELEHLLDDDDDMARMYLTQKLMRQRLSIGSSSCFLQHDMDDERLPSQMSSENIDNHDNYDIDIQSVGNHYPQLSRLIVINEDSYEIRSCSTKSRSKHHDVEELEMLLEAYFVQIDSTLSNLSTLREYVDDTEDYINVMLDDKQNHLLQTGVMLTTATLIVSAFVVLTGIFGINIKLELFDEKKSGNPEFLWTVGGGATGSLLLYAIAIAWCKYRRLLD